MFPSGGEDKLRLGKGRKPRSESGAWEPVGSHCPNLSVLPCFNTFEANCQKGKKDEEAYRQRDRDKI